MSDHADVRFYFSFRSPYAWIAAERVDEALAGLPVDVERVAIYPDPEDFPNDPVAVPNKSAYIPQDVIRLTRHYGLELGFPSSVDTDWVLPHAAQRAAEGQGCGREVMLELFRGRWSRGQDIGDPTVIDEAVERAGGDPAAVREAAADPALRAETERAWTDGMERDRIFGVPSFVYRDSLYFGQDRLEFLRAAIERKTAT